MYAGKDNYSVLMEQLPDAYAYHKIITDHNGTPVDYIFLRTCTGDGPYCTGKSLSGFDF